MAHRIKPEDLEDYIKFIAVNRGCPVESVDRNKAHWNFIMNKTVCMEQGGLMVTEEKTSTAVLCVVRGLQTGGIETGTAEMWIVLKSGEIG